MKVICKSILIFVLIFNLLGNIGQAQEDVVKWKFATVKVNDSVAELQFAATIEPKWHLYAQSHNNGMENPIVFTFTESAAYKKIGKVVEPKPVIHYDPDFQDTSHYFVKQVTFKQKIKVLTDQPFEVKGVLDGQACIDGRCVAVKKKFTFEIIGYDKVIPEKTQAIAVQTDNSEKDSLGSAIAATDAPLANQNEDKAQEEESLWQFFLMAIGGGLIGLLMPCVFPMIPMTVSFFMKQGGKSKRNALIYGFSIVVIYVIVGVILSLIFGADFGNIISTHWLPNCLFAVIFIIFAISLLGYFEISLPSSWVNKSAKMENSGGIVGIFFMALTLVLVSFSCTLPIAGAVALNSAGGSLLKPIIGMLGFSLGIAVPFTLFAFFPGLLKNMPKSGGWMNTLKVVLAFIELAFALKFLNVPDQTYHWRLLDREVYLAFWIVIFGLMGFYLLGKIRFPLDNEMPYQKSWVRFILALCTFTFVVYLIPGMFGAPLKAISGWLPPVTTQDFELNRIIREESSSGGGTINYSAGQREIPKYGDRLHSPYGIKAYFDYEQALRVAKAENKPVFIDFTGHGCTNCRKVENAVWEDKRVRDKFNNDFVLVTLYVDDKVIKLSPEDRIKDQDGDPITDLGGKNMFIQNTIYKENSQPCYFVVNTDGKVLTGPIYAEYNTEKYLQFMNSGLEAFKKMQP
ncbi:MAG: thioredoxin family protein [Bacteroidales bacterium]|jgi:thiol:disulfide interchange protein DsbD|nr:thioredoxin family protein [Bacteroidales bacterium]